MANDRFSKSEAIKFGWEAMKNNMVAHAYVYRRLAYGVPAEQPVPVPQTQEAAAPPEA